MRADSVIGNLENSLADQTLGARASRRTRIGFGAGGKAQNEEYRGRVAGFESFRRLFHVPDGDGAQETVAAGREFVEEGLKHKTELARLGVTEEKINQLGEDLDDINRAVASKAGANTAGVGATAGVDSEIERGMSAEIFLDAMMKNVYRDNPVKLAEWKSARHLKRSDRPARTPNNNQPTS